MPLRGPVEDTSRQHKEQLITIWKVIDSIVHMPFVPKKSHDGIAIVMGGLGI